MIIYELIYFNSLNSNFYFIVVACGIDFIQVGGYCYYFNPPRRTEIWDDAKVNY